AGRDRNRAPPPWRPRVVGRMGQPGAAGFFPAGHVSFLLTGSRGRRQAMTHMANRRSGGNVTGAVVFKTGLARILGSIGVLLLSCGGPVEAPTRFPHPGDNTPSPGSPTAGLGVSRLNVQFPDVHSGWSQILGPDQVSS